MEGHKTDKGGEAEGARTIYPGEDKARGDLANVCKYLQGACNEDRAESIQWCPGTEEEVMGTK